MRAKAFLRTVCAFTTLAPLASAQQFVEPTHRFLPPDIEQWDSVAAAGDVDGDGDQDLVLANVTRVQGLANDGTGRFARRAEMSVGTGQITSLLLFDYDGDGDLDVISGHDHSGVLAQSLEAIENLGGFQFRVATGAVLPALRPTTQALAAVDVDRDGDLDLVVSNRVADWLLLNQAGRFVDATGSHLPNASTGSKAIAIGDVDGDGDVDLFFAAGPDRLHINDSTGRFVLAPAGSIPIGWSDACWLVDLDGDGAVDLLRRQQSDLSVVWNNGGQFGNATPLGAAVYPLVGNLGGPVILDRVAGGLGLLRFDRSRRWQQYLVLQEPVWPSLLLDIDADGDGDLLGFGFGGRAFLYTNGGWFTRAGGHPLRDDERPYVLAAADLNGDGFDDLIAEQRLLFNDGTGVFEGREFPGPLPIGRGGPGELAAGDVDGDSDTDLVYGVDLFGLGLYHWMLALNDGQGRFSTQLLANLPADLSSRRSVQLADLNGDGRPDLVWCTAWAVEYAAGPLPIATARVIYSPRGSYPWRVLLADVDADGDLDLLVTTHPSGVRLLLNDGAARFTEVTAQRLPVGSTVLGADAVTSGDVDGDGDLDLFIGGRESQPDALYVNDGTGTFADRSGQLPPRPAGSGEGALFDIDGDGDLDIATRSGEALRNDGRGVFTLEPQVLDAGYGYTLATLDVDRDGDRDLVLGNKVFVNLHRQLLSPYAPRIGRNFPLEIHARSTGGAGGFAALLLSATRQSPPIPVPGLGLLGLHPWFMVNAGGYPIAPGSTRADVSFAVPALPGLVGVDLYGQALVWSGTRLDLTNVVTSTVCY